MEVKYECCCGFDVHKKSMTACVIVPGAEGQLVKVKRSFGTMSEELGELSAWLKDYQVTTVSARAYHTSGDAYGSKAHFCLAIS